MKAKKNVSLAVAGHIDHGKTTIVEHLTNKNTDRLREERERGISINIDFAFFDGKDVKIGLIDLPGHEKFIKNMIAGAGSVNGAIIAVAADDGIMPQTEEHLNILHLLGVNTAVLVITKTDLVVKKEAFALSHDVKNFIEAKGIKVFSICFVNNKEKESYDDLKEKLFFYVKNLNTHENYLPFRLDVDRSFTLTGLGTIITGTTKNKIVHTGDKLMLYPQEAIITVKELQTNGWKVEQCEPGQRTAMRISELNWKDIERGDIVATRNSLMKANIIDVVLQTTSRTTFKKQSEVSVFVGTAKKLGHLNILNLGEEQLLAQISLDHDWFFNKNQLGILKFEDENMITTGFKVIRDGQRVNKKNRENYLEELKTLIQGNLYARTLLLIKNDHNIVVDGDALCCELNAESFKDDSNAVVYRNYIVHRSNWDRLTNEILDFLTNFHEKNPLLIGATFPTLAKQMEKELSKTSLLLLLNMMKANNLIKLDRKQYALKHFDVILSDKQAQLKNFILKRIKEQGLKIKPISNLKAKTDDAKLFDGMLRYLVSIQSIKMIDFDHYISTNNYEQVVQKVNDWFASHEKLTIDDFKLIFNVNMEQAIKILERLDEKRVTIRINENYRVKGTEN